MELLTDSSISKSCRVDQGRELKPWVPDGEAPEGLDDVFDKPWKRYIHTYLDFMQIYLLDASYANLLARFLRPRFLI